METKNVKRVDVLQSIEDDLLLDLIEGVHPEFPSVDRNQVLGVCESLEFKGYIKSPSVWVRASNYGYWEKRKSNFGKETSLTLSGQEELYNLTEGRGVVGFIRNLFKINK